MHKRALLLTAATFALLSGGASATTSTTTTTNACLKNTDDVTDITKSTKGPLCTSTADSGKPGDILIETNGTVTVAAVSGTTPTVFPAITIDSSNLVTNKGTITFAGTNNAVGVQLDTGNTGGFDFNAGTLTMNGTGTNKTGILITDPTAVTAGTFTGVAMPGATTPLTTATAIYIESAATLSVQGDGSTGIKLNTGDTVAGDIIVDGIVTLTPTKTNETSAASTVSTGIDLEGTLNGNLSIVDGTISVEGAGARGIVVNGTINGEFDIGGTVQATGTSQPNPNKTTNATSGIGVLVQGNITGGILNDGPVNASTTTNGTGLISVSGGDPAMDIVAATGNVTIGVVNDANNTGFSFINRGTIAAASPNPETSTTAVILTGSGPTAMVNLTGGIFDSGAIASSASTKLATASTTVTAIGLEIGNFVNVPNLTLSSQTGSGGSISATVTGDQPGIAQAVLIAPNSTLGAISIDAGSSLLAGASTTDDTNTVMEAIAINDLSGSLTTIKNDGSITASASKLSSNNQVAVAISASSNINGLSITNGGTIAGDIILGTGADTLIIGDSTNTNSVTAAVVGNVFFGGDLSATGGATDKLTINSFGTFAGQIEEPLDQRIAIAVNAGGSLIIENNGVEFDRVDTNTSGQPIANICPSQPEACGVQATTFTTATGSNLTLDVAQIFNQDGGGANVPYIINAQSAVIADGTNFSVGYGSFINAVGTNGSQFVLVGTPNGALTIGNFASLQADVQSETPFLFDGSLCTVNVLGSTSACATTPKNFAGSGLILTLDPKTAKTLGLQGFAASMFDHANAALANDTSLGAAVISAGLPVNGKPLSAGVGAQLYQDIYTKFAPDVTGSARAIAISLTDQASGEVGARQRELRMYAGQPGDTTIWGQEFTQNLNVGSKTTAGGYNNTGFGFVLGADGGNPRNGRYGAAFQFYSGDTNEKSPRTDKTNSEWLMLTGYTDWRGRGFFFDSQASMGYAQLHGQRFITVGQSGATVSRDARGDRASEFLSGGATTGVILAAGGTVFMPQLSLDGLTMREEGYTETSSTQFNVIQKAQDGFDLTVKPNYMNSVRLFAGADVRQDLNFGDFYLQPELRAGYRYDFLGGQEKVKAAFVSQAADPANYFTIMGPDPARGNLVLGGGLATTTGAWSVGISYDYVKGFGSTNSLNQVGTFTIVGRM